MKPRYVDVCRGEIRIGFIGERITSLQGGPSDLIARKYAAIDGLRVRIGELNRMLDDCISATDALAHWEPR